MRPRRLYALRHDKDEFLLRTTKEYGHEELHNSKRGFGTGGTCWFTDGTSNGEAECMTLEVMLGVIHLIS